MQAVAVDLAELVRNMAALVASTTGPQVHVELEVEDTLPPAKGDPNQLEMALLNLSVNARDAMPDGGTLRISAKQVPVPPELVPELGAGPYLCLSVSDTGTGMDEETIARAIEPFFSTKGVGKGTGLGLSMVHGLASQLGGKLSIRSEVGIGTTIELWLPETTDRLAPPASPSNHESFNRSGTALLVDDEEAVRTSTAIMLNELGYEVIEAQSAEDAVALLGDGVRADIVITDHLMPGMSGVDLARVVRKRRPDLPILLVSGYADTEGVAPDLPRLAKPFARSDLVAALTGITQETMA